MRKAAAAVGAGRPTERDLKQKDEVVDAVGRILFLCMCGCLHIWEG